MANHKSALKRARQNEDRRLRNRTVKTRVKNVTKAVNTAAPEDMAETLKTAQSTIDKAAKRGTIHKRAAARKISRLAKSAKKAGA